MRKPKLNYEDQIKHLKEKGITFNEMSEEEALDYLEKNNYLFKLSSYRKNYPKDITNSRYVHLDFAVLVDLAIIDMYIRSLILKLSLNIEHYAKVELLKKVTDDPAEDGYSIVSEYLKSLSKEQLDHVESELKRNSISPYCRQAYFKYQNDLPIWVFIEIISFGSFISFYKFCVERLLNREKSKFNELKSKNRLNKIHASDDVNAIIIRRRIQELRKMKSNFYLFLSVKKLRNATAHNNCIINDLRSKSSKTYGYADIRMVKSLRKIGLSGLTIYNKLSNERIFEIITCLYAHKHIVTSKGVNRHISSELHELINRFFKYHDYEENDLLKSTFETLSIIIDKWFPIE